MATTTTLANDIGVICATDVVQGFFRNDEFFSKFPQEQAPADTSYRWHILTAGLTGTLKSEGDAFSAVQSTTNSRAALGYHTHDSTISVTDDLLAALGPNGSNSYWQGLGEEVMQQRKAIQQAVMTRWLGSTAGTDGLQLAVDATNTYAGLDHAAITGWASVDTAISGPLTYAALDDHLETLRDDPRRSRPFLWLMPENQVTNYTRLQGPGVRQTMNIASPGGQGNTFDLLPSGGQAAGGIPIMGVAELTDTVIIALGGDVRIRYRSRAVGDAGGGWASEPIARGGFVTAVNMSWQGHICVKEPRLCGILTAVTA